MGSELPIFIAQTTKRGRPELLIQGISTTKMGSNDLMTTDSGQATTDSG